MPESKDFYNVILAPMAATGRKANRTEDKKTDGPTGSTLNTDNLLILLLWIAFVALLTVVVLLW